MYRCTLSWSRHWMRRVVHFPPLSLYFWGMSLQYPSDRKLGGPQSRSGLYGEVKILDSTVTRTPKPEVVQLVASCFTDCATAAPSSSCCTYSNPSIIRLELIWFEIWRMVNSAHGWACCKMHAALRKEDESRAYSDKPWRSLQASIITFQDKCNFKILYWWINVSSAYSFHVEAVQWHFIIHFQQNFSRSDRWNVFQFA